MRGAFYGLLLLFMFVNFPAAADTMSLEVYYGDGTFPDKKVTFSRIGSGGEYLDLSANFKEWKKYGFGNCNLSRMKAFNDSYFVKLECDHGNLIIGLSCWVIKDHRGSVLRRDSGQTLQLRSFPGETFNFKLSCE
jgi:hypothetical protein